MLETATPIVIASSVLAVSALLRYLTYLAFAWALTRRYGLPALSALSFVAPPNHQRSLPTPMGDGPPLKTVDEETT